MNTKLSAILKKTYENTNVNVKIAALVILIFIVLVIGSWIAILYASGQRPTGEGIITTGTLRIQSYPTDIDVTLDTENYTLNNRQISGIRPGEYTLELNAEGYNTWTKEITIRSGLVTELDARLIPEELNLSQFTNSNIDQAKFSPDGEFVYYIVTDSKIGQEIGIWKERITLNNPFNILGNSDKIKIANLSKNFLDNIQDQSVNLIPSPNHSDLLVKLTDLDDRNTYFLLDANNLNNIDNLEPLSSNINFEFTDAEWFKNDSIIISNSNLIAVFDIDTNQLDLVDFNANSELVYTNSEELIVSYNADKRSFSGYIDSLNTIQLENIDLVDNIVSLDIGRNSLENLYFMNTDDVLYFLNTERSFQTSISEDVQEIVDVSPTGEDVIYLDKFGKYYVANITFRLAFNSYEVEISELTNLENIETQITTDTNRASTIVDGSNFSRVKFSSSGNSILALSSNQLFAYDNQGDNPTLIFPRTEYPELKLNTSAYEISITDRYVYVLLNEELDIGDDQEKQEISTNIYRIALQI